MYSNRRGTRRQRQRRSHAHDDDVSRWRPYRPYGFTMQPKFLFPSSLLHHTTVVRPRESPIDDTIKVQSEDKNGAKALCILSLDTHSQQNSTYHHTDKFDLVQKDILVVRRGQPFTMSVTFGRSFDTNNDSLRLVFETGPEPLPGKGTYVRMSVPSDQCQQGWCARVINRNGNVLTYSVTSSPVCVVGEWRLLVESLVTGSQDSHHVYRYRHPDSLTILFNPWCKDDTVFFEDEDRLTEYILNDSGCIFTGTSGQIGAKPWVFGQFEEGILEAAIFCLHKAFSFTSPREVGNPIRATRAITKMVNSNDEDDGVLIGNWTGEYEGGRHPSSWTGSVAILREYMRTGQSVKWGQCFVFSGVVTSICRALGIPCRSVTNFSSAHDTDASCTIDVYPPSLDDSDSPPSDDSVWNFHVWNEAWLRRPDLPAGYDGWQVIDATPQERSDGLFQCGPAPLQAILNGNCGLLYDAPFIFAEVNADEVSWTRDETCDWSVLSVDKTVVGRNISTKVPDGIPVVSDLTSCEGIREDITHLYKYDEESERERMAVLCASRYSTSARSVYNKATEEDVQFEFVPPGDALIGQELNIEIKFQNKGPFHRTVTGLIICEAVTYTGIRINTIKVHKLASSIEVRQGGHVVMTVSADDYLDVIDESAHVNVSAIVRIPETKQTCAWQRVLRLRKPDLTLTVMTSAPKVGEQLKCRISFKNPLHRQLKNCEVRIDGPGLDGGMEFQVGTIAPLQDWSAWFEVIPRKAGHKQVTASLQSDLMTDVHGVAQVDVVA